jgi:methyl-accepting chemotaxis protein
MKDFIYKLFPFRDLIEVGDNFLTAFFVLIIVLIFLAYAIMLLAVTRRLKNKLKKVAKDFSEQEIQNDKQLGQVWKDYHESFIDLEGIPKTDEFAYDYFNEKNLLSANTNLKLVSSIPSILVGLGILGTFVGLTYGISSFQTSSTEAIKKSIETLLLGMGTAFVSSLWGMGLSITFTFLEKVQINSLHSKIHDLCYLLDRKFKISKDDERRLELANQKNLLLEYFLFKDENGNEVKPGNVFRDMFNESKKQSVALQSFSTDLANLIEAGFEKILNDPEKGVMRELQSLNTEISNLGDKLQDPATDMIEKMLDDLKKSLGDMVKDFNKTVSGSAKGELESLTKLLGEAGGSLNDFPGKLEIMTDNLNENFKGLQNIVKQISKDTLEQSKQSTDDMKKQVEDMSKILKTRVGDLQVGQEVLMTKQTENLQMSDNLLGTFKTSIERLNELSSQVNETVSSFGDIQGKLESAINGLSGTSENVLRTSEIMEEVQLKFSEQSNQFLEKNKSTLEEIQNSLTQAKDLQVEYSQKFEIIENGLQGVFQKISNGLEGYQEAVGVSMEKYLVRYSEALTTTAQSLSGAASKQEEILEELTEQLSKLKNR